MIIQCFHVLLLFQQNRMGNKIIWELEKLNLIQWFGNSIIKQIILILQDSYTASLQGKFYIKSDS